MSKVTVIVLMVLGLPLAVFLGSAAVMQAWLSATPQADELNGTRFAIYAGITLLIGVLELLGFFWLLGANTKRSKNEA